MPSAKANHVVDLTAQQAAELVNVPRRFLSEQLQKGIIPFHGTGSTRRILLTDLLAYQRKVRRDRYKALEKLTALDQQLGIY